MKKQTVILLLFISIFNLAAQSLPADLKAAVIISESGGNQDLLNTIMNYKKIQKVQQQEQNELQQSQLLDLNKQRDTVSSNILLKKRAVKRRKAAGWTTLITSALAGGAYALFTVLGNESYDDYLDASITADVIDYREQFQMYDILGYVSLGVAGVGAIASVASFLTIPSMDDLNNEYNSLSEEIQLLEGALQ